MRTVLVTGFEPFGGGTTNPSATIARALDGARIEGRRVVGRVLPVSFTAAVPALLDHLADQDPELVVALGQAGGRASIAVERVAINVADASMADNDAARPVDVPVVPGGPVGYWSTLPIKSIVHALRAEGLPADVSQTAGTFVCNHLFYALMHALADRPNVRGGFLHVPYTPEQIVGLPQPTPSLAIEEQVRAVRLALATALRTTHDPPRSGGSQQGAST